MRQALPHLLAIDKLTSCRGKAYGIFDVKWLFFATAIMFEVGSAICGAAPNMNVGS